MQHTTSSLASITFVGAPRGASALAGAPPCATRARRPAAALPSVVLLVALLAAGCGAAAPEVVYLEDHGPPDFGPDWNGDEAVGAAYLAWFEGRIEDATSAFDLVAEPGGPLAVFGRAEMALLHGDAEQAALLYGQLLERFPTHPLSRLAIVRLDVVTPSLNDEQMLASIVESAWASARPSERVILADLAAWYAERASLAQAVPEPGLQLGQPVDWRWVGPFSPFSYADFGHPYVPETQPLLDDHYLADSGRPLVRERGSLERGIGRVSLAPGVYYFETFFEVQQPTAVTVVLKTHGFADVWVDGAALLGRDDAAGYPPARSARQVTLAAGTHRVLVKHGATSSQGGFALRVLPTHGAPPFALASAEPGPTTTSTPGPHLRFRAGLPDNPADIADDPFMLWLVAVVADHAGEHARGRRALQLALPLAESFAPLHAVNASLLERDMAIDPGMRAGLAVEALRRVLEIDPSAAAARLQLARTLIDQDQVEAALGELDRVAAEQGEGFRVHYERFRALEALGWEKAAAAALTRAAELRPSSCTLAARVIDRDVDAYRILRPESVPAEVAKCPAIEEALARNHYLPRGEIAAAIGIFEELEARFPEDVSYPLELATLYWQQSNLDAALDALDRADALERLVVPRFVEERVDLIMASGDEARAQKVLLEALAADPSNVRYRALLSRFDGDKLLAELRVDGLAVVQGYLNDEREYPQSAFYLLDYAAFRYFPDGTSISVTHQISRVQNKDAQNKLGEVYVPAGAQVTNLRTIKADGRTIIEPEVIPNKQRISMPNLDVGDFIEVEYIAATGARVAGTPAFIVPRWYFQIFEAPLMYSELVIELPKGTEPLIDIRGDVVAPEVTDQGEYTRYRYLMTEMLPPRPEPGSPTALEIVPSVQLGYGVDRSYLARGLVNSIRPAIVPSAYLEEALELGRAGASDPLEVTRRLFKFVKAEIADEGDSYFGVPASWVWTARSGSRFALLKTLLDMAGVPNEVVVVKPFGATEVDNVIPDLSNYSDVLLRVEAGEQVVWLNPTKTHARFDYAPPELQGRPGLMLTPQAPELTVPRFDDEIDRQNLVFDLVINEAGDVFGNGSESSDGTAGTGLRNFISRYRNDPDGLRQRLAEYLVPYFGNVRVQDYSFDGVDAEGRVTISYAFDASSFAHAVDGGLEIETVIFSDALTERFAALPARTHDLLVPSPVHTHLEVTVTVPEALSITATSEPVSLDTPFGRYSRRVEVDGNVVRLVESLDLEMRRVSPAEYPAFQEFARNVDNAQVIRLSAR